LKIPSQQVFEIGDSDEEEEKVPNVDEKKEDPKENK
jgi:hypothetical protein